MIKANELRIGNWLHYHDIPVQVYRDIRERTVGLAIDGQKYNVDPGTETPYTNLDPIELSAEILKGCGFFPEPGDPDGLYLKELSPKLFLTVNHFTGHTAIFEDGLATGAYKPLPAKVRYLHQVQNLYNSLTGRELDVKF